MSAPSKASTSYIWALLESGGLSALALVTLLILARLIGPTEFGIAALALGIVQILTILVEMMLHDAIVQRRDLDDAHNDTAFWTSLGVGLALAAICAVAAGPFARLMAEPSLQPILSVAGLSLAVSGIGCVPIALLRRSGNFKALALRSLFGRLGGATVGIAMAFLGFGVWSLIAQHLIVIVVGTAMVWPASRWRPTRRFSTVALRELMSFGIFSIGTRMIWALSARLFTVLCGLMFGVTAAGYLNIAQRIIDTLYDALAGAASQVALPHFSRRQDELPELMRAYRRAVELATISALPVFAGIAICAPSIISLFLGDAWLPAVPLARLLAVGAICQFLFLFIHVALNAAGQPGGVFAVSVIGFAVVFTGLLAAQPADIITGTAIWVARIAVTAPVMLYVAWQHFGALVFEPFKGSWAPIFATLLMTAVLAVVNNQTLTGAKPLVVLAVTVPLGVVLYTAVIGLTSRDAARRFIDFIVSGVRGLKAS